MSDSDNLIRVLLADDHAVVRQGIRQFLEASGPVQGGGGAAGAVALGAGPLPVGVLVLTAFDDEPYVRAVLQAGANGYVLKTADAEDIVEAGRAARGSKAGPAA